jgi:hypothetical protein
LARQRIIVTVMLYRDGKDAASVNYTGGDRPEDDFHQPGCMTSHAARRAVWARTATRQLSPVRKRLPQARYSSIFTTRNVVNFISGMFHAWVLPKYHLEPRLTWINHANMITRYECAHVCKNNQGM